MHGQVLATFVGLQSPEVLPEHDVCLTVLGMLERRERGGGEWGKGEEKEGGRRGEKDNGIT